MRNTNTIILEPDEYKTGYKLNINPIVPFIPKKTILITKNGEDRLVETVFNVDDGCRIELKWSGKGKGRVKHLTSTPRRKYYMGLMWFSLILWALAWIFTVIEVNSGNFAGVGNRTDHVLLTAFTAWMGLDIVTLRNGHGFTKWFTTVFSYLIMFVSVASFIIYLVKLVSGF
ncbi:MAG: hypothetical protein IK128_06440 [Clostridiales bacterium]|nr:hypothetical protein [Clostridiales bacterium]